ncbi:YigZ family protein [Hutsoniella sourekii]
MSANYYSIKEPLMDEIEIKKSRFITYLIPIHSEEEFQHHLKQIRKEHYKATHHCQAFILEEDASVQRAHDDGEPSGTAGVPMLEVLKQNDLTFIMAVVVRYFGGVKLGAGGLIRAYSSAVSEALKKAIIIQNITQDLLEIQLDYSQIDLFQYFLETTTFKITVLDTQYTDQVTYQLASHEEETHQLLDALTERFSGQVDFEHLGKKTINLPINK